MSNKLTLTHEDDDYFTKGMIALAVREGVAFDAPDAEIQAGAEAQLRLFLREAVKDQKMREFEANKRLERKQLAAAVETELDSKADGLNIVIE